MVRIWLLLVGCVLVPTGAAEDWPEWLGPNRSSIWEADGIVSKFGTERLQRRWSVPIDGGYSGPAVAAGRVFVTDYKTDGDRTPNPNGRNPLQGVERILCLSADTGERLWQHSYPCSYEISYPAGPRCTPTVDGDRVYTLGAMGHLLCLSTADGKVVWSRDFVKDFQAPVAMWGFCGHPLVVGDRLYCVVGGEGSVAVCFDKHTGKELWRALSASQQGYSPPTLIDAGGTPQLLIWHADALVSLNPESGDQYWSIAMKPSYGMAIGVPRVSGDLLFAGAYQDVSLVARLGREHPTAEVVWRGNVRKGMAPVNMTPFLDGGFAWGVDHQGDVRCIRLETGERVWSTNTPITHGRRLGSATGFVVRHQDRYFIASEDGSLVIARMTPEGYEELDRAHLLDPTQQAFGRKVVWSHPAFANKCVFARNDKEIVCVSLASR